MQQEFSPGRATLWAALAAAALLVTVILPAEYGIDWTGAGRVLGLTAMGEQKVAAANAAAAPAPAVAKAAPPGASVQHATRASRPLRVDSIDVTLPPKAEIEYKAVLGEGDTIVYEWDAGGATLGFDFHGEPSAGPEGSFLSFEKGSASRGAGAFNAPFAGTHGWYWQNSSGASVVIRLKVSGFHSEMKKM